MKIANYSQERALLTEIGCRARSEPILFLRGLPDTGKTSLLRWLQSDCCDRVRVVRVNLYDRERGIEPVVAMNLCVGELGWTHFKAYDESALRRPIGGRSSITGNTISGNNITVMASAGATEQDQLINATELTDLFIAGLTQAASTGLPIMLCFDGYGLASWVTRRWVDQALVPGIRRSGAARLVLTSQTEAEGSLLDQVDEFLEVELKGIHEVEEWIRHAEEIGLRLPGPNPAAARERLIGAVSALQGTPGSIVKWLNVESRRTP